ncbi:MAG TPA: DUF6350 family protein [Streptosporangiaceae bacterium]|nr:DUF6350 family protein [Streptosporangiaceae bacterium]
MAACTVMITGLVILTPLVLAGWIAAPHAGLGLPGVLRTAIGLWLAAHHVGFALHGAGRIGMLPLGLVLLPGALLWRAGRWLVRTGQVSSFSEIGYAALALAAPYAVLCGALALASRSPLVAPSLPQAVAAGFLIAFCAGGLGGARALAPWGRLARLLPPRPRSVVLGTAGALAVLGVAGAILTGASLAAHLPQFMSLNAALGAGAVGSVLLVLIQFAYVPNAVGWAVCFTLGPGFAFGTGTVVAPTGAALGPLPMFPMLAALPAGAHASMPGWASAAVLAVPYLAGAFGGVLLVRAAPTPAIEVAPLWGFACGAATGCVTGVLAAFSGGPLGSGRLAAVGPSGWQAGLVATLEVGVAAAVAAGAANWLRLRRDPELAAALAARGPAASGREADDDGHRIFLDPWADDDEALQEPGRRGPPGPSELP